MDIQPKHKKVNQMKKLMLMLVLFAACSSSPDNNCGNVTCPMGYFCGNIVSGNEGYCDRCPKTEAECTPYGVITMWNANCQMSCFSK